jgi:uncharacterized protein (UPF0332 family)
MSLENWLNNGWLKRHQTSQTEVQGILGLVSRDIKEACNLTINTDWRMNMAFNASLQCANAALMASGYRAASQTGHHERIINSLKYTIGMSGEIIDQLNKFRNKRIKATYDLAGAISDYEVEEAIKLAKQILKSVIEWLAKYHPELSK